MLRALSRLRHPVGDRFAPSEIMIRLLVRLESGLVAVPWARDVQAPRRVPPGAHRGPVESDEEPLQIEDAAKLDVTFDESEQVPAGGDGGMNEPLLSAEEIAYLLGSEEDKGGEASGGDR